MFKILLIYKLLYDSIVSWSGEETEKYNYSVMDDIIHIDFLCADQCCEVRKKCLGDLIREIG